MLRFLQLVDLMENPVTKGTKLIQGDTISPDIEYELVLAAISLDRSKDERICEIANGKLD
jgi:hypothetical protein